MTRSTNMVLAITRYEPPDIDPFHFMGVRELARATGYDPSNLSRYKNGKMPCPMHVYLALCKAVDEKFGPDQRSRATHKGKESANAKQM